MASERELEAAMYVLTVCGALLALQLAILTVEVARMRRDILAALRILHALNETLNPWAVEDEPTNPNMAPHLSRPARKSFWIPFVKK